MAVKYFESMVNLTKAINTLTIVFNSPRLNINSTNILTIKDISTKDTQIKFISYFSRTPSQVMFILILKNALFYDLRRLLKCL